MEPVGDDVMVFVERDGSMKSRIEFRQTGWRCRNGYCHYAVPMRSRALFTTNERGPVPRNF